MTNSITCETNKMSFTNAAAALHCTSFYWHVIFFFFCDFLERHSSYLFKFGFNQLSLNIVACKHKPSSISVQLSLLSTLTVAFWVGRNNEWKYICFRGLISPEKMFKKAGGMI